MVSCHGLILVETLVAHDEISLLGVYLGQPEPILAIVDIGQIRLSEAFEGVAAVSTVEFANSCIIIKLPKILHE